MPEGIESMGSTAGHAGSVTCVQFSPDGDLFASGSWDKTIKIWDTESGDLLLTLVGHTDHINSISFAPNGAMICSGSSDGAIRIFDTKFGRERRKYISSSGSILSVCFSPNGLQIAAGCENASIEIWDLKSSSVTLTLYEHTQPVNSLTYSEDGQHLLSASSDKTLKYWSTSSGKVVTTINTNCANYSATITPDGEYFVSGGKDKQLKICSAITGKVIKSVEGHSSAIRCVTCSPNNAQFVSAGDDNRVIVWHSTNLHQLQNFIGSNEAITSLSISPSGEFLLLASEDRAIKVYDTYSWINLLSTEGKRNLLSDIKPSFKVTQDGGYEVQHQNFDNIALSHHPSIINFKASKLKSKREIQTGIYHPVKENASKIKRTAKVRRNIKNAKSIELKTQILEPTFAVLTIKDAHGSGPTIAKFINDNLIFYFQKSLELVCENPKSKTMLIQTLQRFPVKANQMYCTVEFSQYQKVCGQATILETDNHVAISFDMSSDATSSSFSTHFPDHSPDSGYTTWIYKNCNYESFRDLLISSMRKSKKQKLFIKISTIGKASCIGSVVFKGDCMTLSFSLQYFFNSKTAQLNTQNLQLLDFKQHRILVYIGKIGYLVADATFRRGEYLMYATVSKSNVRRLSRREQNTVSLP